MNSFQNNALEAKNISKAFEGELVLNDISLKLQNNEFVSIVGSSGSGKSTLFNIISGLLLPDSGSIFINGENCTGKSGYVSYMHQKDLLLPWKKIIDNVSLPLRIKGQKKKGARASVLPFFELFGLDGSEYKYPHQLSGGMRQRAALLRTYMFSKDIMLLDEPFSGLDAITKAKMHTWLKDVLASLNTSVLFITHDIEEAVFLSDRVYVFSEKPAVIKSEVVITLPKERDITITTSEEFNRIKRNILNNI